MAFETASKKESYHRETPTQFASPEEEILQSREVERTVELLGGFTGDAELVKLKNDGLGVFKPHTHQDYGDRIKFIGNERAAYLVDRFLGFNFVPPTIIRSISGKLGSLQQFVENSLLPMQLGRKGRENIPKEEILKLCIFDYIIGNTDRGFNNYLLKGNQIYAIDHGHSFVWDYVPREFEYKGVLDLPVPEDLKEKINGLALDQKMRDLLDELLTELLERGAVNQVFARLKAIRSVINQYGAIPESSLDILMWAPR